MRLYGTFSFIVRAADSGSLTASQIYTIEIANSLPVVSVQSCANGTVKLLIAGDAGLNYTVFSSANLVDWESVFSTNAPAMPFNWTDTGAGNKTKFYRVRLER